VSLSAIGRTGDVTIRMIMNANGKATHTVTSHWYCSSRACGVGSGEWVAHYSPCARVGPESESVCPSVWVSVCVPKLSGV